MWAQRPGDPMHLVLVARGLDDGLVLVETQPHRGGPFTEFAVGAGGGRGALDAGLPHTLAGPVRLLVDDQGRLLQLDLSDPARAVVAVSDEPVHLGGRVADALLEPATTASPGMPPRRRGSSAGISGGQPAHSAPRLPIDGPPISRKGSTRHFLITTATPSPVST